MLEKIRRHINGIMAKYTHSAGPTTNEVYIAWLLGEVDRLTEIVDNLPKPAPSVAATPEILLKTQLVHLTRGDVDILNGSENRNVRIDPNEDKQVKELYEIWKSL